MLKSYTHDLIVIASPDETHFKILKDVAFYKPKVVICEKPIAPTLSQLKKIIALYKRNKIKLIVNFSRRFNPSFLEIKKDINKTNFGNIQIVNMTCSRGMLHNGSHLVDLALWYFGFPEKVEKVIKNKCKTFKGDFCGQLLLKYKKFTVNIFALDVPDLGNEEVDIKSDKYRVRVNHNNELERYKVYKHPKLINTNYYKLTSKSAIKNNLSLDNLLYFATELIRGQKKSYIKPYNDMLDLYKIFSKFDKFYK